MDESKNKGRRNKQTKNNTYANQKKHKNVHTTYMCVYIYIYIYMILLIWSLKTARIYP